LYGDAKWVLTAVAVNKYKFQKKSKMADDRHFKTVKSPYLWNFSTDFDKIWHGDAYWFPEAGAKLRFSFRTIFMAVLQIKELLKYILYNYKYQNL